MKKNNSDQLKDLISRFVRVSINSFAPRDKEYALQVLKSEFKWQSKYIDPITEIKDLYHKYRIGADVMEILNSDKFYRNISPKNCPELFKLKPGPPTIFYFEDESVEVPNDYEIIEGKIQTVKRKFIKLAIKYIAWMEFKRWVEVNGIEKISIIKNDTFSINNLEISEERDLMRSTICKNLMAFLDKKAINQDDFNKLIFLLQNYFKYNPLQTGGQLIFVKNGHKKKFATALGCIFKELRNEVLPFEYIKLAIDNISIFNCEKIDMNNFRRSNLYKYFADGTQ